ncbi:MAG: hypothetical protein ICV83_00350 [Cytophagales bacterium]|nr:hypothetical protein [Cytophagales bacterium]
MQRNLIGIIERANEKQIILSVSGTGDLSVRFPRESVPEAGFLKQLKEYKHDLIQYLKNIDQPGAPPSAAVENRNPGLMHEGRTYYEVGPEQNWWVKEGEDEFKQNMFLSLHYKISGSFDVGCLEKTIAWLFERHESLRATFRRIEDKYYMAVEDADSDVFRVGFRDVRHLPPAEKDDGCGDFLHFKEHAFDLKKGPLFLVRLVQTDDETFWLSMKIHHAIFDTWSFDVLVRDFWVAYRGLGAGVPFALPPLKYQYKDYMTRVNTFIRTNYRAHKAYWHSLYNALPGPVTIPGAGTRASHAERVCRQEVFRLPKALLEGIHHLSRKHSTTAFIVLQAAFKQYLSNLTGQRDLVIGTQVFGRDFLEGSEDQIGLYARMCAVRSIMRPTDSFEAAIRTVKKSNEDTQTYWAYPLFDMFQELMAEQPTEMDSFWKFHLQYQDGSLSAAADSEAPAAAPGNRFAIEEVPKEVNISINLDMKLQFFHAKEHMTLKVTYDNNVYPSRLIGELMHNFVGFIDASVTSTHPSLAYS